MSESIITKNLPELIGAGYGKFWNSRKRYLACKGGRASKKSTTAFLRLVFNMMKYSALKPNALVVRRYYNSHRDTTHAQLVWAINRLGVRHLWQVKKSDLTLTFLPTGQKIIFGGMDDTHSIHSITAEEGHLCWVVIEEAYQIWNEQDFNNLDLSIRGDLPAPLFKQFTIILNPWSDKWWGKARFFDDPNPELTDSFTTTFKQNEWLDDGDRLLFKEMEEKFPHRFAIEGLGEWGISEGQIYTNWKSENFNAIEMNITGNYRRLYGLDFGFANDPSAFIAILHEPGTYVLYLYDEFYKKGMMNHEMHAELVKKRGLNFQRINADNASPGTIAELQLLGVNGVRSARGATILDGIQKLQDYQLIVHPSCVNTIMELSNYIWDKDKNSGKFINTPIGDFNHLMDAMRYATEDLKRFGIRFA